MWASMETDRDDAQKNEWNRVEQRSRVEWQGAETQRIFDAVDERAVATQVANTRSIQTAIHTRQ